MTKMRQLARLVAQTGKSLRISRSFLLVMFMKQVLLSFTLSIKNEATLRCNTAHGWLFHDIIPIL